MNKIISLSIIFLGGSYIIKASQPSRKPIATHAIYQQKKTSLSSFGTTETAITLPITDAIIRKIPVYVSSTRNTHLQGLIDCEFVTQRLKGVKFSDGTEHFFSNVPYDPNAFVKTWPFFIGDSTQLKYRPHTTR